MYDNRTQNTHSNELIKHFLKYSKFTKADTIYGQPVYVRHKHEFKTFI